MQAGLGQRGISPGESATPVIPLRTRGTIETIVLWRELIDSRRLHQPGPAARRLPRLRLSFMATHTTEHLDRVLDALGARAEHFLADDEPDVDDGYAVEALAELAYSGAAARP